MVYISFSFPSSFKKALKRNNKLTYHRIDNSHCCSHQRITYQHGGSCACHAVAFAVAVLIRCPRRCIHSYFFFPLDPWLLLFPEGFCICIERRRSCCSSCWRGVRSRQRQWWSESAAIPRVWRQDIGNNGRRS